ncbi:hypothetical protein HN748_02880 [Candidatus Peregrinibacteria bacterium]|jgi:hypothetical protein|nr:hypothetical protein [Candidatus Peregrinibacteria bacterium]MBT7483390.1 hypothetical protein [Candidatus Peregrinibacteria bacterium]MBT7703151.1 hypothetical protein [Candidatus Peregrinibacteria bacterium]
MKNLFKKTCGFLLLLSLLLTLNANLVFADNELPDCSTSSRLDYVTKNTMGMENNRSYIVTELREPISAFDEVIISNGIHVSEVFMKYKCAYVVTQEPAEGDPYLEKDYKGGYDPDNKGTWNEAYETSYTENDSDYMYIPYSSTPSCPEGALCTYVQVLIGQSGTGLLKTYISILYRWAASVVGIIAVLVIVISGIQISMDQGSGESVGAAKNRIMQSLSGLVVLFLSALILYTINPTFFSN